MTAPAIGYYSPTLFDNADVSGQDFGLTQAPVNNAGFRPAVHFPVGQSPRGRRRRLQPRRPPGLRLRQQRPQRLPLRRRRRRRVQPHVHRAGRRRPRAIATADLNDDGNPDLLIASQDSSSIDVLLGNGDGIQPHARLRRRPRPTP